MSSSSSSTSYFLADFESTLDLGFDLTGGLIILTGDGGDSDDGIDSDC